MVVVRKKKTNNSTKNTMKCATKEGRWRQSNSPSAWDTREASQDMHSDSRKDMKRKAPVVTSSYDGRKKDAYAEDLNHGKASLSHNASKGKKGFSHKDSGKPHKPNHKGTEVNNVVKATTLGWEKSKWPHFTPSQTNPTFSFDVGSPGNGFTNREMDYIPQGESCASTEVNH